MSRRRSIRAVCIVAALVAAVVATGAVEAGGSRDGAAGGSEQSSLGAAWQQQLAGLVDVGKRAYEEGSAETALAQAGADGAGGVAGSDAAALPESYRRVVAVPAEAQGVHATDDCSVVGFWVPDAPEAASAAFAAEMERRGWASVALGDVPGATFIGGAGAQSWALAQFTSVAEGASAVIVTAGLEDVDG